MAQEPPWLRSAAALVILLLALPVRGGRDDGEALESAIVQANKNAKVCNQTANCLGKPVTLEQQNSIQLKKELTLLDPNAHLIVVGKCPKNSGNRCVIDGNHNFSLFTFFYQGTFAKVELYNLIIQNFKSGVFYGRIFATINSTDIIYRNNDGVVVTIAAYRGHALQYFDRCRFIQNTSPVFSMGAVKYGLALNGTALFVKNSIFEGNTGGSSGIVAAISGRGIAQFEDCKFSKNTADQSGGVLYASETTVQFRRCQFTGNQATYGPGGAVAGYSGFFQPLIVSFCSCSFSKNIAPQNSSSNDLWLTVLSTSFGNVYNATVNFCNTVIPAASILPQPPYGTVNNGTGRECESKYCY